MPAASTLAWMESELDMATTIENRVKELRLARGWTQEELARAVGVSRQSINSIERHRYVPSLPLALTFARVFGLPTDEIFRLTATETQRNGIETQRTASAPEKGAGSEADE